VCAVSYLNTVPLVWGMLHGAEQGRFDFEFRLPSECADRMASGEADIGIVPAIEWARQGLALIRGAGIACRGPVRSILLVAKSRPERIRTLAADSSSRTSVMLARIVLEERYGSRPEVVSMPPDLPLMLETADAALIIGDPALRIDPARLPLPSFDLGQEWWDMTGLPMVFAVWGCRPEVLSPDLEPAFASSCRFGRERIDDFVAAEARARNLPEALARDYLTHNIVNELGEREYEGMRAFLERARRFDTVVSTGGVAQP
jgi:chorismate dehydratase